MPFSFFPSTLDEKKAKMKGDNGHKRTCIGGEKEEDKRRRINKNALWLYIKLSSVHPVGFWSTAAYRS